MPSSTRQVKCPRCGQMTEYSDKKPYRPFCSERCQQIDFGAWTSGSYAIPVEDAPSSSDGSERGEGGDDDPASSGSSSEADDEDGGSAHNLH